MDKYAITVEVRDENHKLIKDIDGNPVVDIKFELEVFSEKNLEHRMREIGNNLKVWLPNRDINVEASVFNSISDTYMSMYAFYVNENRYVKFT
jgi:hypothetical protein